MFEPGGDDELAMLQQESELTVEELLARYKDMREETADEGSSNPEGSSQTEGGSNPISSSKRLFQVVLMEIALLERHHWRSGRFPVLECGQLPLSDCGVV